MTRDFSARASNFLLAPKRNYGARLTHLLPSAPLHQFPLVYTVLHALFPDDIADPLPSPAEVGLPQLPFLHFAHDRMDELALLRRQVTILPLFPSLSALYYLLASCAIVIKEVD